jgi:mRNA-degrading endonuclease RelE of RelBE toxin-antitoxin system
MSFSILPTGRFLKQVKVLLKKYPSLKKDIESLSNQLTSNPTMGTPLGKNCYKIRLAIKSKNKGKSGGSRVISLVLFKQESVYLLSIYDKSEQDSISDGALNELISLVV